MSSPFEPFAPDPERRPDDADARPFPAWRRRQQEAAALVAWTEGQDAQQAEDDRER